MVSCAAAGRGPRRRGLLVSRCRVCVLGGRGRASRLAAPILSMILVAACSGMDTHMSWSDVRERYLTGFLKRNPITSTYLGGDGLSAALADVNATLPDVTPEGRADETAFYRSILGDLGRVDPAGLSPDDAIDRDVVVAQVRFMLHLLEDLHYDQRSVDTYTVAAFRGVDWQIQQMTEVAAGGRGTEEEWDRVARRVEAIPGFLSAVRTALE